MRDLFKILIGILILLSPQAYAENFKLLVIPDNIATETVAVDSYIYNASSEFFADEIINMVPIDKILTETDSPYLTPEPLRGKRNDSRNVKYIAEKIAKVKNISVEELNNQIYINLKAIYKKIV